MHSETAKLAHHFAVAKAATNFTVPVILAVISLETFNYRGNIKYHDPIFG